MVSPGYRQILKWKVVRAAVQPRRGAATQERRKIKTEGGGGTGCAPTARAGRLKSDLSHIVVSRCFWRKKTRIPPVSYLKFTSNCARFNPGMRRSNARCLDLLERVDLLSRPRTCAHIRAREPSRTRIRTRGRGRRTHHWIHPGLLLPPVISPFNLITGPGRKICP